MATDWTKFENEKKRNGMVSNRFEKRNWFAESESDERIGKDRVCCEDLLTMEPKTEESSQRCHEEDHEENRGTPVLGAGRISQGKDGPSRLDDDDKECESTERVIDYNHELVSENEEPDDKDDAERGILGNSSREDRSQDMQESGSQIRREAREELKEMLQESPRRPSSLYREDTRSPQKSKSSFAEKRSSSLLDSASRIGNLDVEECQQVSEKSTEKLVNGKSPKEEKHVYHVQFNKDPRKEHDTSEERPHPSPSVSISSSSSSSSEDNSSLGQFSEARAPDGGWGWVVVAAAFMVNLIADGITFSFGVIFVEFLNYFGEGKSKTAWIGSLFMAMPLLSGPVASFLTDRYGCRKVSIAGSILATTGFVISSFATSMELLIFTFGIVSGFGLSLCFVAAVVIVAYYFDKKRSFATGLSVCGSGIGTFIFAPLTQYLLAEYGWRGTTLILAGLFLNLAVCGCLMRDLEWTTTRAKAKTEERKQKRRSRSRIQSSSADSFSASSSANTTAQTPYGDPKRTFASANTMIVENPRSHDMEEDASKVSSSLVSLPTFVKNGEKVPLEVLELLSARKGVYNVLLQNYPGLLNSSRSFSDSGNLHDQLSAPTTKSPPSPDPTAEVKSPEGLENEIPNDNVKTPPRRLDANYLWWLKKIQPDRSLQRAATLEYPRKLPASNVKDTKVHRHSSLTYRGAILNINRYRLRASSCPDIYRNSMTTSASMKFERYSGLWEFWDLIVDMLDFSYFADSRFLLFAISNFLLHFWYDVPYVYLTDNAIEMGWSQTDASILISVIGITNMVGEIVLGWAGDRAWVNASMVYAVSMSLCGAFTALIPIAVDRYYLLCVVSGAFGLFIAANYSLTSIILVELITLERFTNAYGLLLLVQGIANLMGPPLAGWLYDITRTYDLSFYLAGFFIALSGALLMVMPLLEFYRKWKAGSKTEITEKNFARMNNV